LRHCFDFTYACNQEIYRHKRKKNRLAPNQTFYHGEGCISAILLLVQATFPVNQVAGEDRHLPKNFMGSKIK
jgi:hypothetical protein